MFIKSNPVQEEEKTTEEQQTETEEKPPEPDEIVSQEIVGITQANGEFSFVFEPLSAENFWIYFVAEGYRTRIMQINELMRSRFFLKPNKSPIKIDVVLEKN